MLNFFKIIKFSPLWPIANKSLLLCPRLLFDGAGQMTQTLLHEPLDPTIYEYRRHTKIGDFRCQIVQCVTNGKQRACKAT